MKLYSYDRVELTSGFLFEKQELNRKTTINAVYDRFKETGRFDAFRFDYREGDPIRPHYFWDSDVAKWIEGVAYVLKKHPTPELERVVDELVEQIEKNQCEDGYFNIFHTVVAPEKRWQNRHNHELYCAGHLMEAAVAYAESTGKTRFLTCMERYADYIYRVFVEEGSAAFVTPGHEEIELALVKMYRYTGKKKYLDLSAFFIDQRGCAQEPVSGRYIQSHLPVREQTEAVGHAVRALYLYVGMAYLAHSTDDQELINSCKTLWRDVVDRKMYVTGGVGSTYIGEAFTHAYDLPNDTSYAETCASIALMLFGNAMLALENNAEYADVIERAFYNGVLSGLSQSGDAFFYENALEINLSERFDAAVHNEWGDAKRRFPITRRPKMFQCSCCPPNINRLLSSLGNFVYGRDGETLYVNQYAESTLTDGEVTCRQSTDYPRNGLVKLAVKGISRVALRVPLWCDQFTLNLPYTMENGYAVVENTGDEIVMDMEIKARAVWSDARVLRDVGRVAIMRGPVVYCAEGVDNGENLHALKLLLPLSARDTSDAQFDLPTLELDAERSLPFESGLYSNQPPKSERTTVKMIPYHAFANRDESNMLVWMQTK